MKNRINTIVTHDDFIKDSMQRKEVAKEFFETHLPANILSRVNLDTLDPVKDTFVDNMLGKHMSDIVYSVQFGNEAGYIVLLLEHQSTVDYHMPLRIMKYMLQICSHQLKSKSKLKYLPLVYPAIVYHGKEKYDAPLDFWSLFADPELAKSFYMGDFHLIDLNRISDDELRERLYAGVMSYLLKHIYAENIGIYLDMIAPLLAEIADKNYDYMLTIMCYTLNRPKKENNKQILEKFTKLILEKNRSDIMTFAESMKAEGIAEGIEKGIEKGIVKGREENKEEMVKNMLANNLSISLIEAISGLSEEKILEMKRKLMPN